MSKDWRTHVRALITLSLMCLCVSCGQTATSNSFGPFPSNPLGQLANSGKFIVLPIGSPAPPVTDGQFVIGIQNEDNGGDREPPTDPDTPAEGLTCAVTVVST